MECNLASSAFLTSINQKQRLQSRAVVEAIVGSIITVLLSTGATAAVAAARRSSETRDAVLRLSGQLNAMDGRLSSHVTDNRAANEDLSHRLSNVEQRVTALEAGVVNRRALDR